jgi:hypothetical protein
LKTNIPQSVELGYQQIVTLFFGGNHSAYAFQQKTPSSLARVQELLFAIKKYCQLNIFIKNN